MAGNFEIFRDADRMYRFHLMDEQGDILVTSSGYGKKGEAVTAITAVRENAAMGHIKDRSEPVTRSSRARREARRSGT